MPEVSRFYGIVVLFFYDDHDPPHFHVRHGSTEASIEIVSSALIEGRLAGRAAGLIREWATLHRSELLENWRLVRMGLPPRKIAPLP